MWEAAAELFEPIRKLNRQDLLPLRVLLKHNRRTVPTVGGMLLFGKNRLSRFSDAYLKAALFKGTDRGRRGLRHRVT